MGQAARSTSQEYWRPANSDVVRLVSLRLRERSARVAVWTIRMQPFSATCAAANAILR